MALSTDVTIQIGPQYSGALDFVNPTFNPAYRFFKNLASGVGANQADKLFTDQRTLAASGTENLDLAGSLVDAFGATLTFVKLKLLAIFAAGGNTNTVDVTRPATNGVPLFNAASGGLSVRPGGAFIWFSPDLTGVAVTAGTGDLITVTNGGAGTSITYDVFIVGTSA